MEELKFCRICFCSNGKFYDMEKSNLVSAYQALTQIVFAETVPQLLCSFCYALLSKFIAFKEKCISTHNILRYALVENQNQITQEILESTRKKHKTALPYTIEKCDRILYDSEVTVKSEECEEIDIKFDLPILSDNDSDDEPLSKRVEVKPLNIREEKQSKKREEKHLNKRKERILNKRKEKLLNKREVKHLKNRDVKHLKNREEKHLEKREENHSNNCEENGNNIVKEIKNECLTFDDIFDEIDTNYEENDEGNWPVKKSEESEKKNKNAIEAFVTGRTLTREEQLQEILDRKKSENYLNAYFKCEICFRGYLSKTTYDNHMAKHNNLAYGSFICDLCHLRCKTKHRLDTHKLKFHQELFTCSICFKGFKTSSSAKLHCKWHAGIEYKCDQCDMKFRKLSTRLTHMRLQHPSPYCCHICGESFLNELGVNLHIKRMHQGVVDKDLKAPFVPELTCVSCNVQFRSKDALNTHIDTSLNKECDPKMRSCVVCGSNFKNMITLKSHQVSHQDRSVKCTECNKICNTGRSYQLHYQTTHLGLKYKPKLYEMVCEVCGGKYKSKNALTAHQRTHTGERPFACSQCPKKFSVQQQLQIHTRTHTGESPYKCAHCPKAFKHKAALNRHDRVHSGIRPYSCVSCGKSFSQSNSLKMHVRTVHLKMADPYKRRRRDQ